MQMEMKKRWWDWPAGLLVVFLVGVVAARLSVTNWSPNLWMMNILALFGVILGLLLGASRFGTVTVLMFSLSYSGFFLLWQLGMIVSEKMQWSGRLFLVFERLKDTLNLFFKDIPVSDPLLFLTFMGLLIWILALTTGFRVARYGKPWWPIIILTFLLVIVDFYHPFLSSRNRYSGLYFFLTLLLLARLFLLKLREGWAENAVMEDSEIGINLTRWMLILSLAFVLAAWNLPVVFQAMTPGSAVQRRWERSWEIFRDRLSNAVAGLTNPVVEVSNFYGPSIELGQRAATGDEIIFKVEIPRTVKAQELRYYWKARSYDLYETKGWVTSSTDQSLNPANDWRVSSETLDNQTGTTLNITSLLPVSRTIVAPGIPINFSRAVQVQTAPAGEGEIDILGLQAEPPMNAGEVYRVQSRLSDPTIKQLKESGEDYPDWIIERYLVLPDTVSPRIVLLAKDLTRDIENPYDKAVIITNYLRNTISYTEEMERPPGGKDVIEWFLFDYQKGFCNYYASAEVLMLRSLGVPARLSAGFAIGEFVSEDSSFIVRKKDSHAWPEVYFVGVGWVEFEPTTAQPERVLPEDKPQPTDKLVGPNFPPPIEMDGDELPEAQPEKSMDDQVNMVSQNGRAFAWFMMISLTIVVVIIFILRKLSGNSQGTIWERIEIYLRKRGRVVPEWLLNLGSERDSLQLQKMLRWINLMLTWLGKKLEVGMTAGERVSLLLILIPQAEEPGRIFLQEYEISEYSSHPADMISALEAGRQIRKIFLIFILRRMLGIK